MNYGAPLHSSMSTMDNTIQYHGGLQTRKFGQTRQKLFQLQALLVAYCAAYMSFPGSTVCCKRLKNLSSQHLISNKNLPKQGAAMILTSISLHPATAHSS